MRPTLCQNLYTQFAPRLLFILLFIAAAHAASIKDFGAAGNGVTDDTPAIQRAINAAPPGSVLTFPAGTYRLASTARLKSGITYQGVNSPVLLGYQGTGPNAYVLLDGAGANDMVVTGIVFDGGGLALAQFGGWTHNISVAGNTFRNLVSLGSENFSVHAGIYVDQVSDLYITANTFSRIIDGGSPVLPPGQEALAVGIRIYHASHATVADNVFDYVSGGIAIPAINDFVDLTDIRLLRNQFTRVHRMAIEIQSGAPGHPLTGLVVDRNIGYNWLNAYWDTYGISLAAYTYGAQLTNNFWDASPPNPGFTFGMCMEVDGDSTLVDGNSCLGSNNPVGWGTTNGNVVVAGVNVVIRNNVLCGGSQTIGTETPHATYQAYSNVFPPCGVVTAPPGAVLDTVPPSTPTGLSANPVSSTQIALSWLASKDNIGVAGYSIFRDGSPLANVGGTSFQDFGLVPGSTYSYTVLAYDAAGNQSPPSSPVSVSTSPSLGIQAGPGGPLSDNFDQPSLDTALWTFVNPVGDASLSFNAGHAVISIPAGKSHDAWSSGNLSARLLQPIPNADFDIELKLDSTVMRQYQIQGILVEQDPHNYIRFDVYSDDSAPHLFAASFVNDSPSVYSDYSLPSGGPIWLRLKRAGTTWTGTYSFNGVTFTPGVTFAHTLNVTKIGPFAGTTGEGNQPPPAFTALFDYWANISGQPNP